MSKFMIACVLFATTLVARADIPQGEYHLTVTGKRRELNKLPLCGDAGGKVIEGVGRTLSVVYRSKMLTVNGDDWVIETEIESAVSAYKPGMKTAKLEIVMTTPGPSFGLIYTETSRLGKITCGIGQALRSK